MESHIKIKATVPEMKDFFDKDGGVRYMEIKDKRFDEAALKSMPEAQYSSEKFTWDVVYRHKELEKPLTGTFTINGLQNKINGEKQEAHTEVLPVYKYPSSYAREHDELEIYRASHRANIACRDAIDNAIRDNYRDNSLSKNAVRQVVAEFGYDRTFYVLANTVREKEWDGRFDHNNKDWARTIPVFEDNNGFGDNRNREFIVDRSHPCLVDLFVTQARREYMLSLPLTKEDIQAEAARILGKLQAAHEPNSPNGTHFIAEVSPDFLHRAKTKDTDKLFALLPFQSLSLSTLNDRKGVYAIISKDENRNQPLQKRKPSVRDKLKQTQPSKTAPVPKNKDMEL